eukprot:7097865-Prymnesium_polylepis.1
MVDEEPKKEPDNTPGRDGLHSAPSPSQGTDSASHGGPADVSKQQARTGLHSAPAVKPNAPVE